MAVPKKRTSIRIRRTRYNHTKATVYSHGTCSHCGELKMSHAMCGKCGYYNGRLIQVIKSKTKTGAESA